MKQVVAGVPWGLSLWHPTEHLQNQLEMQPLHCTHGETEAQGRDGVPESVGLVPDHSSQQERPSSRRDWSANMGMRAAGWLFGT